MKWMILVTMCGVLAVSGCEDKAPSATTPTAAPSAASTGTKHDPAIKPDAVAAGHWYCGMNGSVHYSQKDKGDKCPLCGMALKEKT